MVSSDSCAVCLTTNGTQDHLTSFQRRQHSRRTGQGLRAHADAQAVRADRAPGAAPDLWAARREALMLLDRQITAQASVIAYSRIYVLSALLILALIPLLALVKRRAQCVERRAQCVERQTEGPGDLSPGPSDSTLCALRATLRAQRSAH